MAQELQLRRGTKPANDLFTGQVAEASVDTTNNTLRVHDSVTVGGIPVSESLSLESVKDFDTLAEGHFRSDRKYIVSSFWPGLGLGGGAFRWNPDRPKSEHDGGTVIDPNQTALLGGPLDTDPFNGYFTTPTSSNTGCLERIVDSGYDALLEDFGCTGAVTTEEAITACFASPYVKMVSTLLPEIEHNGFTVPEYKVFYGNKRVEFISHGTITVEFRSIFWMPRGFILASSVTTPEHSIIRTMKRCVVNLMFIEGYRAPGSTSRGDGTTAKAIDNFESDFVNIFVSTIRTCKYGFFIRSGATGSGDTVNWSKFVSTSVGQCQYAVYKEGSSSQNVWTEVYIEQCNNGYYCEGSFYGQHTATFDGVGDWFVHSGITFRSRFGRFAINNITPDELLPEVALGEFYDTIFSVRGGDIHTQASAAKTPRIIYPVDSEYEIRSTSTGAPSSFRLFGNGWNKSPVSVNDNAGGAVHTLGTATSKFVVERDDGTSVFEVPDTGLPKTRSGFDVGDSSLAVDAPLNMNRGDVVFARTQEGVVLKSPNGTNYRIKVDDAGALTTEAVV